MQIRILVALLLLTSATFGQTLNIDNTYNFSPSKLSKAEQEKKLPALDKLWDKVKSDTANNLPLLRRELNAVNHNPFFYYDCAGLLLSLTKNDADKAIAANAISKCDLGDINQEGYVRTLSGLSLDGIDVTKAAVKILNDTSFSFFLPQHVMYFKQDDCLMYMLLPEKPGLYVDTLVSLFRSVNLKSQESILVTLWFAFTCKGDSLINAAIHDKTINKGLSKYAKSLMDYSDISSDLKARIKAIDQNQAEELKKGALQRFSDEALDDLMIGTLALRKVTNCR